MIDYFPISTLSHFSLLNSISRPEQVVQRCVDLNYKACAITDLGNVSGAVSFGVQAKEAGIKPLFGIKIYVREDENSTSIKHQTLIAKNIKGWKQILKLISLSATKSNIVNDLQTVTIKDLETYCDNNLVSYFGDNGSVLEWFYLNELGAIKYINSMKSIFKDNLFLGVSTVCDTKIKSIFRDYVRDLSKKVSLRTIAASSSNYCTKEDAIDHRILLASMDKTTLNKINKVIQLGKIVNNHDFFIKNHYHIPTTTESIDYGISELELENSLEILSRCDDFSITNRPSLPKFQTPNGESEEQYLLELCRKGWIKRAKPYWDKSVYGDRVKKELQVFKEANLEGYFLIVQDYVNWAKNQGWLVGPGRGSAAGSLVAYLLGITNIDPIPFDLLFERFYNAGRNTKDKVSYPDIDVDFPVHKREQVIQYVSDKYGKDKVAHISTFGRLQGRGAIKEVLRINETCAFDEINRITENIPQEFQISDQLEEDDETSILRWTIDNEPERLSDWVFKNEHGKLDGMYGSQFEQAIRLEGVYKSRGKHAAGIVIATDSLENVCPLVYDPKTDEKNIALNMKDTEAVGLVKMDMLGLLALDRLSGVNDLLMYGFIK